MKKYFLLAAAILAVTGVFAQGPAYESKRAPETTYRGVTAQQILSASRNTEQYPALTMAKPSVSVQLNSLFETQFNQDVPLFSDRPTAPLQKVAAVGETFYGYLAYSRSAAANNNSTLGLQRVSTDGTKEFLWRDQLYIWQRCGFYHDGMLWLFRGVNPNGRYTGAYLTTCNLADGKFGTAVKDLNISDRNASGAIQSYLGYFITMAFDPDKEIAYGYSMAGADGSQTEFASWSMANMTKVNALRDVTGKNEMCSAMTFHNGKIYGVTVQGKFVEVAPDGTQTVIFTPAIDGWLPNYVTAMVWSPSRQAFIYNALTGDANAHESKFYLLDPTAKSTVKLADLTDGEEYYIFFSEKEPLADKAPSEVTFEYSTKGTPDLTGNLSVKLPANYADGSAIDNATEITLTTYIDNEKAAQGNYAAGATATIPYELAQGTHLLRFEATVDGLTSTVRSKFYVGYDVPNTPATCTLDNKGVISWRKVTAGVNSALDAYFVADDVTYDIYLDGEIVATDLKATAATTKYTVDIPAEHAALHNASVVAKYHGNTSARRNSTSILIGNVFSVPFTLDPLSPYTSLFKFAHGTAGSTKNWSWYNSFGAYRYYYDSANNADAWLFLPAFDVTDTDMVYEFAMNAWIPNANYNERFEVYMGNAATIEAMNTQVIGSTDINNTDSSVDYTGTFMIEQPGTYYIGIHCISDKDNNILYANNFRVRSTDVNKNAPAPVTDLVCTPAPGGELKATVEFTLPTATGMGATLTAASLTATVSSEVASSTVSGAPGQRVTAQVETKQGFNDITVKTTANGITGQSATTRVYTGLDLPGMPKVTTAPTANDMGVTLTWTAPEVGENGGYVDPTDLTYQIYQLNSNNQWTLLGSAGNKTSVNLTSNSLTELSILTLGVRAANSIGQANYIGYDRVVLGPAMTMPVKETFAGAKPVFDKFIVHSSSTDASLYIDNPTKIAAKYESADSKAIFSIAKEADTWVSFNLPKVSTVGVTFPAVILNVYKEPTMPSIDLTVRTTGAEVKLGTISFGSDDSEGWKQEVFMLPESMKNKQWAEIIVRGNFTTVGQAFVIDDYQLRNYTANDLAVKSLAGPTEPAIGQEIAYVAKVANNGYDDNTRPAARWTVTVNGKTILEKVVEATSDKLLPEQTADYELSFTPTVSQLGKAVVKFELTATDEDTSNNAMTLDAVIGKGDAAVVTDLAAERIAEGVRLTWSAPELDLTEGFENETPFVVNPAVIGKFKTVDADGKKLYGFSDWDAPCPYDPAAFTVWNADQIAAINPKFNGSAFAGKQYLIARCPQDGTQADDWLISPLAADVESVSFALRSITYNYGAETVEVLASSTTDAVDQFKLVQTVQASGTKGQATVWQEFTVDMPEGTQYFALRYVSKDVFGLMVDNVSYVLPASVSGYEILRDGVKIADKTDTEPAYVDATALSSQPYTYNVVPVLADGSKGILSNEATVSVLSGIDTVADGQSVTVNGRSVIFTGFAGKSLSLYSVSGIKLAAVDNAPAVWSVNVTPGNYIAVAGNVTAKVTVK